MPLAAHGHEVRPAYLHVSATSATEYDVLWKQPVAGLRTSPLAPVFPGACEAAPRVPDVVSDQALVRRLRLICPDGLDGETIRIAGLAATITDVMVRIDFDDGRELTSILRPAQPELVVDRGAAPSLLAWLVLGVEHLLFGLDHILFVIALMYFVTRFVPLAKTVTAFTVAHSVTLGLSALELMRVPQAPVEAVIALSILFLAVEKLRGVQDSLTSRHTWIVAFGFGLLHGFGFAGALADIGLPRENLLLALFLFNVGVEVGQLLVVAAVLALVWVARRIPRAVPDAAVRAPLYAVGSLAAYWFVGRTVMILS